jgi:hypothetical protein
VTDLVDVVNLGDLEALARERLTPMAYEYYAGGAGDEPSAGTAGDAGTSGAAGEPSSPLFEADQEDGSLERWDSGPDTDAGGWYGDDDSVPQYSGTGPAHSGTGAVEVTVDTAAGDRISRLYRRLTVADAYYSAWFYLLEDHAAPTWWSIFLFRAVQDRAGALEANVLQRQVVEVARSLGQGFAYQPMVEVGPVPVGVGDGVVRAGRHHQLARVTRVIVEALGDGRKARSTVL